MSEKRKIPKIDNEVLKKIWDASRHSVQKNKKKYSRKSKHKDE
jgi:hypothetical protein